MHLTRKSFPLTIDVTEDDIRHGEIADCDKCPIARALIRSIDRPLEFGESVQAAEIELVIHSTWSTDFTTTTFLLPDEAQMFIENFDDSIHVEPFRFQLEYPS